LIFDKFSPTQKGIKSRRQLLFSETSVKPFNDPDLYDLFFDKQLTYENLSKYTIPTVSVKNNTLKSIYNACQTLTKLIRQHQDLTDFNSDIIMKDRFGAGGRHVYKFKSNRSKDMLAIANKNPNISFVIQPFIPSVSAPTDIRFIYLMGKIVQSYIRVAAAGEFRCNEHQGGLLTYLPLAQIPPALVAKSSLIADILDKNYSLFALDFIISNNGNTYLLEGNTGPGLDWDTNLKTNEIEAKKLIRLVVSELAVRVKPQLNYLN
jgi:glutathione synthase/RimK-type ligase-like ATP-grasp enzyme